MMAVQQTAPLTINTIEELDELDDLPERFEVIEGVIVEMPSTNWRHTVVSRRIFRALLLWLEVNPIGELAGADGGYVISRDPLTTLVPDISFISRDHAPASDAVDHTPVGAPDLVVEVLSPSDRNTRMNRKVTTYLNAGAALVLVVDPIAHMVTVYSADRPGMSQILRENDRLDGEDVLPGFQLPLEEVFAPVA